MMCSTCVWFPFIIKAPPNRVYFVFVFSILGRHSPIFAQPVAEEVIGGQLDGLLGGHQRQVDCRSCNRRKSSC